MKDELANLRSFLLHTSEFIPFGGAPSHHGPERIGNSLVNTPAVSPVLITSADCQYLE